MYSLEKGEILTFSYKDLTNEDLLLEKGIAVNNNINDYLSFKVSFIIKKL